MNKSWRSSSDYVIHLINFPTIKLFKIFVLFQTPLKRRTASVCSYLAEEGIALSIVKKNVGDNLINTIY